MSTDTVPAVIEKQLLTHSRQDSFKTCRKKHWFSYELGIRREVDAKALRMGSAYHSGLESLGKGCGLDDAVEAVRAYYDAFRDAYDQYEWEIERETVVRLLCGYQWRWENDELENVATEQSFQLPLRNPETGKTTPLFDLAGKIDGIVRRDGRLGVKESKLLGDDIGQESDLWLRLRIDHQISMYVLAARKLGYAVDHVYYDVTRKPTIKPSAVPVLDALGAKIVLDARGERVKTEKKEWRQTGDTAKGYVLQTRPMTVEEWGDKLTNDITERPDFYYVRREIPRLDQDLAEYEVELWEIQRTIRDAQRNGHHFRTANKNTCAFCPFFGLCTTGFDPERAALPEGFVRVVDIHPELERN